MIGKSTMHMIRSVPLIVVALVACIVATAGIIWLWWRWSMNYIWLNRYIVVYGALFASCLIFKLTTFRPTMIHSLMGMGSAFLSIYRLQNGQWTVATKVTVGVTAAWFVITLPILLELLRRLQNLKGNVSQRICKPVHRCSGCRSKR